MLPGRGRSGTQDDGVGADDGRLVEGRAPPSEQFEVDESAMRRPAYSGVAAYDSVLGPLPPSQREARRVLIVRLLCLVVVVVVLVSVSAYFARRSAPSSDPSPPSPHKCTNPRGGPTVLVSMDGFRYDYPERTATPNLAKMAADGVRAGKMRPQFPAKTFPNHWTLVTGLHPESHGIVANTMYDPVLGWFRVSNATAVTDGRWWGGEPIWSTAEKAGRRVGVMFWPGSEALVAGYRPTYYRRYDASVSSDDRIAQVLEWLALPESERPHMVAVYLSNADDAGHSFGPDSAQVTSAVATLDALLGKLRKGLEATEAGACANVVVVSDHGFAELSPSRAIALDSLGLNLTEVTVVDRSPLLQLMPAPSLNLTAVGAQQVVDRAYAALSASAPPQMQVWRKEDVPAGLFFSRNDRITPLLALADVGWSVVLSTTVLEMGGHGYNNSAPEMGAFFTAFGPAIRPSSEVGPLDVLENVDVYALLCHLLDVNPAPFNGSLTALQPYLVGAS